MPNMSKLHDDIVDLESILTNFRGDHTQKELLAMEEDLHQYQYVERVWESYQAVPKADGRLTAPFVPETPDGTPLPDGPVFQPGTPEDTVLAWFANAFCVDPREDLGYDGPWHAHSVPDHQREYTVCLLFSRDLAHVLLQRKKKTDYAGKLNGTGGKLEPGETPEACARREIKEETGLSGLDPFLWLGTLSIPFNCDNHTTSINPAAPACVLHYYASIIPAGTEPKAPEGGEELVLVPTDDVLAAPTGDARFAGDGDLQYFTRKAADMLRSLPG